MQDNHAETDEETNWHESLAELPNIYYMLLIERGCSHTLNDDEKLHAVYIHNATDKDERKCNKQK